MSECTVKVQLDAELATAKQSLEAAYRTASTLITPTPPPQHSPMQVALAAVLPAVRAQLGESPSTEASKCMDALASAIEALSTLVPKAQGAPVPADMDLDSEESRKRKKEDTEQAEEAQQQSGQANVANALETAKADLLAGFDVSADALPALLAGIRGSSSSGVKASAKSKPAASTDGRSRSPRGDGKGGNKGSKGDGNSSS